MKKAFQGQDEIVIDASAECIWAFLEDSTYLTQWAKMVKHTTGKKEQTGSTRSCEVEWNGRKDQVVERCIEAKPGNKIAWQMEQGQMTKLFSKIQFGFHLQPESSNSTNLRLWFLYEPKNFLATIMWHFMMKKQMVKLRKDLLNNLKRLAENGGSND